MTECCQQKDVKRCKWPQSRSHEASTAEWQGTEAAGLVLNEIIILQKIYSSETLKHLQVIYEDYLLRGYCHTYTVQYDVYFNLVYGNVVVEGIRNRDSGLWHICTRSSLTPSFGYFEFCASILRMVEAFCSVHFAQHPVPSVPPLHNI